MHPSQCTAHPPQFALSLSMAVLCCHRVASRCTIPLPAVLVKLPRLCCNKQSERLCCNKQSERVSPSQRQAHVHCQPPMHPTGGHLIFHATKVEPPAQLGLQGPPCTPSCNRTPPQTAIESSPGLPAECCKAAARSLFSLVFSIFPHPATFSEPGKAATAGLVFKATATDAARSASLLWLLADSGQA